LAIIDAATPSNANTTVTVKDTAANILAASPSLLARANGAITLTDKSLSAATVAQLEALDDANTTFSITTSTTPIVDTSANLLLAENAAVVAAADHVTVSDTMSVAKALLVADVVGAVGSGQSFVYNLSDTYSALALSSATATDAANVTVTNLVSASQAKNADDWDGKATYSVRDTAAQLANSTYAAAIAKATAVTATTAADITQAGKLSEMANLASYTIKDDATDVFNALNTLNGSGTADRATVLKAASIELIDEATLTQAVGSAGSTGGNEKLGLGSISGLSFKVLAGGGELAAALKVPAQAAILTNAVSVELNSTAGVSVADLTLLADVLGEAFKYDLVTSGAPATTTSEYYIEDTFSNILVADTAFIEGATTLVVNGTSSAETINMSGFNLGMTIKGGAGADVITGGAGADTIDLTETTPAIDTVVYSAAATNGADTVTGFTAGVGGDVLKLTSVATATKVTAVADTTGVIDATPANSSGAVDLAGKVHFLQTVATTFDDLVEFKAKVTDAGATAGEWKLANGDETILFFGNVANGVQTFTAYHVVGAAGATDTWTLLGTVAVNDGDALIATSNFSFG
jgi:S-layer protein